MVWVGVQIRYLPPGHKRQTETRYRRISGVWETGVPDYPHLNWNRSSESSRGDVSPTQESQGLDHWVRSFVSRSPVSRLGLVAEVEKDVSIYGGSPPGRP